MARHFCQTFPRKGVEKTDPGLSAAEIGASMQLRVCPIYYFLNLKNSENSPPCPNPIFMQFLVHFLKSSTRIVY